MASACSPRANGADCWLRHVPPPPQAAMSATDDPARPEARAANRMARGKRLRGAVCFVETVKLSKHRARPGRSAPSPNRLSASGEESCSDVLPPPRGWRKGRRSRPDDVGAAQRRRGGEGSATQTPALPSPNRPHPVAARPPSPRGEGEPVFENQENATKIRATTVMSMVRARIVSMAAVPNEA